MQINTYIQHKPVLEGPVRLDTLKEGDFFRKSPDGPVYRRLFKHGDTFATLNTRTLGIIMMEFHDPVVEVIVNSVKIELQVVDFK